MRSRPKSVGEVSHQTEVVGSLRKSIEQKSLPHLIFYGPPGTGKTSTILACARDLFGADYRSWVMVGSTSARWDQCWKRVALRAA